MDSSKLALKLSWIVGAILVLLPFHAFLTVWASSGLGHYTLLRLWKEFLLVIVVVGALYLLTTDKNLRRKLRASSTVKLILAYTLLMTAAGLVALATHNVTSKAMWFGLLLDLRYLIFFVAVLLIAAKSPWLKREWRPLLLAPTILVSVFAVVQYLFLPADFLKHFGYGDNTIPPYETINHNINHLRVASTTRGANPLGAYVVLPLSVVTALLLRRKDRRWDGLGLVLGLVLALAFSFSRSAWLGALLSLALVGWFAIKSKRIRQTLAWSLVAAGVVMAGLAVTLRNNATFQNTFLHTQTGSKQVSSNEKHGTAFKNAASDIIHNPLGSGVGTAGPQSYYNEKQTRIAENYFLQIGQEAGIVAIVLFVAINFLVSQALWRRRSDPLALALFASLIGISLINLLSHAWTDDTLAYIWWGFAAIAIASMPPNNKLKKNS